MEQRGSPLGVERRGLPFGSRPVSRPARGGLGAVTPAAARRLIANVYGDSLARTSGLVLTTTVVTATLGFGYWVIAARTYPSRAVGTAAVTVSLMTVISLLSILGTTAAPQQRLPARRRGAEWNLTVTVALAAACGAGVLTGVVGWGLGVAILHSPAIRSPAYGAALAVGVAVTNGGMVLDGVWLSERAAYFPLLTSTVMSVAKIGLLLVPQLRAHGALGIQIGWTAATLVAVMLELAILVWRRHYRSRRRGLLGEARAMRRMMAGNYVVGLGASAPAYAVPVVVGAAVSASSTAYFYSAWRIGSMFFLLATAVSNALFAEGSREPDRSIRRARQAILVVVPVLLLATVVMVVLGPSMLEAFGAEYRLRALGILLLLIAAAIPDALTAVYRTVLRLRGRYAQAAAFMWGLAAVQITLTWVLLPIWGITGAGAAWLIAECCGVGVWLVDEVWHPHRRPRAATPAGGRGRETDGEGTTRLAVGDEVAPPGGIPLP